MSKPSYATYIKDGWMDSAAPASRSYTRTSWSSPNWPSAYSATPADRAAGHPPATGPISVREPEAAQVDCRQPQAALGDCAIEDAFMSAASPGVISLFFKNDYYPSHEAYLFAIADAMRHEYETVAQAGFILQMDCPDLAMGRHIQFADSSFERVSDRWRASTSKR